MHIRLFYCLLFVGLISCQIGEKKIQEKNTEISKTEIEKKSNEYEPQKVNRNTQKELIGKLYSPNVYQESNFLIKKLSGFDFHGISIGNTSYDVFDLVEGDYLVHVAHNENYTKCYLLLGKFLKFDKGNSPVFKIQDLLDIKDTFLDIKNKRFDFYSTILIDGKEVNELFALAEITNEMELTKNHIFKIMAR
ncbi:MAG: hypothetical protein AAGC64_14210 [Bacteroidota bacterium]